MPSLRSSSSIGLDLLFPTSSISVVLSRVVLSFKLGVRHLLLLNMTALTLRLGLTPVLLLS